MSKWHAGTQNGGLCIFDGDSPAPTLPERKVIAGPFSFNYGTDIQAIVTAHNESHMSAGDWHQAKTWRVGERYLDHFTLTIGEESKYADIRTTRNGYGAMTAAELIRVLQGVDPDMAVTLWDYEMDTCHNIGEVKTVHEHGRTSVRFADTNTYDDPGDVTLWREVKD